MNKSRLFEFHKFRYIYNFFFLGTEPCTYYFLNGILNFNVVFIFSIFAVPLLVRSTLFSYLSCLYFIITRTFISILILKVLLSYIEKKRYGSPPYILCLLPMYLWMAVFFSLAHKVSFSLSLLNELLVYSFSVCVRERKREKEREIERVSLIN